MAVCCNCHIILWPGFQQHEYHVMDLAPELVLIIEEWCGSEITDNDQLCEECVNLVIQDANNRLADPNYSSNQQIGHTHICISCGISLSRRRGRRSYRLSERSVERSYIENQIFPRQLPTEAWACNACWLRTHRNAPPLQPMEPVQVEPVEVLVDDEHLNQRVEEILQDSVLIREDLENE